jgi:hypothetical protein
MVFILPANSGAPDVPQICGKCCGKGGRLRTAYFLAAFSLDFKT